MIKPFPKPFVVAKPIQRLPSRKRMTIAAGFMTGDAVILCADSQELIGNYGKTTTQKIRSIEFHRNWRMLVAGSSDAAHYIDLFQEQIVQRLGSVQQFDYNKVKGAIEGVLHQIHKRHIWLRRGNDQPKMQLLIGLQQIQPTASRGLLWTEDAVVLNVQEYRSVGIGTYSADSIKDRLFPTPGLIYNSSAEVMTNYAIYILWLVKKSIQGCDGNTLACVLQNGEFRWVVGEEVSEIEQLAEQFHHRHSQVLTALFNPAVNESDMGNFGTTFALGLRILKRQMIESAERREARRRHLENIVKQSTSQRSAG